MNYLAFFWLGLTVVLLAAEAATVTLVSLWFAGGALCALVMCLLGGSLWCQTAVFLAVSVGLLIALRPLSRKYFTPKLTATNVDSVIGTVGLVTEGVDNLAALGQVKLGGMYWTARSTTGEAIPADTRVRVDRIEGVKVFVTPLREKAEC